MDVIHRYLLHEVKDTLNIDQVLRLCADYVSFLSFICFVNGGLRRLQPSQTNMVQGDPFCEFSTDVSTRQYRLLTTLVGRSFVFCASPVSSSQ